MKGGRRKGVRGSMRGGMRGSMRGGVMESLRGGIESETSKTASHNGNEEKNMHSNDIL